VIKQKRKFKSSTGKLFL